MVSIVVVSHSSSIAEGAKEIASQMAPEVSIAAVGSTADGRIGTDAEKIMAGIESVYSDDGVIVLFDLGSAFMNTELAIEMLPEEIQKKVQVVDAALVEGVITAAVECSMGKNITEIKEELSEMALGKMPQ